MFKGLFNQIIGLASEAQKATVKDATNDPKVLQKFKLLVFKGLVLLSVVTFVALLKYTIKISEQFKEYREIHPMTSQECMSKNHPGAPSDRALGLRLETIPSPKSDNYMKPCVGGDCLRETTTPVTQSHYSLNHKSE